MNLILSGTVGSTAYNLATSDSDVDTLGVFLEPSMSILGVDTIALLSNDATIVHKAPEPDATYHELLKFCTLALAGNPTVNELLWLERDVVATTPGRRLLGIRESFLSVHTLHRYMGYIEGQIQKLTLADGTETARRPKASRHIVRLTLQLRTLARTGRIQVHLNARERDEVFGWAARPIDELTTWATHYIESIREDEAEGNLHEIVARPDGEISKVDSVIRRIRLENLLGLDSL